MNSTAKSENESWLIGIPSSPATSGKSAEIICREFSPARPIPLAHAVSLESLIQEFEADPAMTRHLADARRDLATVLYPDEPQTLTALRLNAGLSQAELALGAGTTQPYIARIERGQADPSTEMVSRIARALGQTEEETFRAIRIQRLCVANTNG